MAGALSKRQQARNERALQELIKSIPGNNVCADCQARNPGWASWSLGIFLCMRCAALHRKLGTHISKVKSLSMDSWSADQVDNMKKIGNVISNRVYNPKNAKPAIPFDADEADAAMERFIRQKYKEAGDEEGKRVRAPVRHNTGSSGSDEQPPPPPPKTGSKFGFRSASSIFPMSSKAKREAAARAHLEAQREQRRSPSPPIRNKPSRVFGAAVGSEGAGAQDLDSKLATLHQMGFPDEARNERVLKSTKGNLEKAIEALIKMGESAPASRSVSRSRTPLSGSAGISIQTAPARDSPRQSNNPFDLTSPLPQSSQSTGTLAHANARDQQQVNGNPYNNSNPSNPFGLAPSQSQYSLHQQYMLDQSLQNMSLGQSQPLFPNHTGGFPNRQPFQSSGLSSPLPTIPQNYTTSVFDNQPQLQQLQQNQSYNPFIQQQTPQSQGFDQAINNAFSANPYAQAQQQQQQQQQEQQQQQAQNFPQQLFYDQSQQQQTFYSQSQPFQAPQQTQAPIQQNNPYTFQSQQSPQSQSPQQLQQNNPFNFQPQPNQQTQSPQQYMQYQQPQQQLLPQQTGRADKSSILALYNYPQLAPTAPAQSQSPVEQNQAQDASMQAFPGTGISNHQQPRSVSSPLASYASANRNPFLSSSGGGANGNAAQAPGGANGINGSGQGQQARHVSQESMAIDIGGWQGQNGRYSPDAFANLSARSMR